MTSPDPATDQQIRDLLHRFTDAERTGDAEALAGLLTDDFACVGPLGFVLTKPQWLAGHRTGDLVYQVLSTDETTVRQYGDIAITISTRAQEATYQGNPSPGGPFRITHILTRHDNAWRVAGFQLSPIATPPAR